MGSMLGFNEKKNQVKFDTKNITTQDILFKNKKPLVQVKH